MCFAVCWERVSQWPSSQCLFFSFFLFFSSSCFPLRGEVAVREEWSSERERKRRRHSKRARARGRQP